jgi:Cdc6-like AAA superfamily ATPase
MEHGRAATILDELHAALAGVYADGDTRAIRSLLTDDVEWRVPGHNAIAGVYRGTDHRWSTVGLYRIRGGQVAACWLLPLNPAGFDRAWSSSSRGTDGSANQPVLILTGAPGSGKTTVARALADRYERADHRRHRAAGLVPAACGGSPPSRRA